MAKRALGVLGSLCTPAGRPAGPGRGVPTGAKVQKQVDNSYQTMKSGMGPTHPGYLPGCPTYPWSTHGPPLDTLGTTLGTTVGTTVGHRLSVICADFHHNRSDLAGRGSVD